MSVPSNINPRKINRGGLTHVPSPRWQGALIAAVLVLSFAILFSYTLLDWDWQQEHGGHNYWAAGVVMVAFAVLLRYWRNDPRRRFGPEEPDAGDE